MYANKTDPRAARDCASDASVIVTFIVTYFDLEAFAKTRSRSLLSWNLKKKKKENDFEPLLKSFVAKLQYFLSFKYNSGETNNNFYPGDIDTDEF